MALFQHFYSVPLARAIRFRTLTISAASSTVSASPAATPKKKSSAAAAASAAAPPSRVLLGMSEEELQQLAVQFGQEKYRGKQLHHLLYKRKIKEIQDFAQVPLAFRSDLQKEGWKVGRLPVYKSVTAADGTIKLLLQLEDNLLVETVGIPVGDPDSGSIRLTACVSSQVGCPLRCSFCATGKGGFSRNLKRQEIVDQVLAIEDAFNHRVTNVVFMGMGEPMLNLKEVVEAHRCLNKDVQIGQRMITISTVGVPNTIKRLATYKLQSTLALSLHAPNQNLREMIVPSAKSYPLDAIMKDCRDYFEETSRRVSFEYTLLAGVNDSVEQATELAELLHQWGRGHHVNLIPFNTVEGSEYKRPSKNRVHAFVKALESRKITVSVRQTRGLDASAACGQLRNQFQKTPLVPSSDEKLKTPVSAVVPSADEQHKTAVSAVVPSADEQHGTAVSAAAVPSAGEQHKNAVSAVLPSTNEKHETAVSAVVPSVGEQHATAVSAVVPSADEQPETAVFDVVPSADEQHETAVSAVC